jgi:hypothetical protein
MENFKLNLLTLYIKLHLFDASFLISVYNRAKCCSSLLETIGITISAWNIDLCNFSMFSCSSSHCPSAICASAANAVFKFADFFGNSQLNLNNLN